MTITSRTAWGALTTLRERDQQGVKTMKTTRFDEPTLHETIDHLDRHGFTAHFGVAADRLRELSTGLAFRADEVRIRDCFRFEGVSDPGDMAIAYAIESVTGVRGTLVDAFGVYSNPAISEFVAQVPIGPPYPAPVSEAA
jgi:hypothetical protein